MTATTATTWRLELRQYSILPSRDLRRGAARCWQERVLVLALLWRILTSGSFEFMTLHAMSRHAVAFLGTSPVKRLFRRQRRARKACYNLGQSRLFAAIKTFL
jgi:hypothetical protein